MKLIMLLLILSIGAMAYRGDLDKISKEMGFPSISHVVPQVEQENKSQESVPTVDLKQAVKENGVNAKVTDLIVKDEKVKPLGLEVFAKEKSAQVAQAKWLESHKVDDGGERLMIDKFHNLISFGKWE
jgi:hypothetical protein